MNFFVFEERKSEEKEVFFKLTKIGCGSILLTAADSDGHFIDGGSILKITNNGKLKLSTNINEDIGLKLNDEGKIKLED